jgi:Acyl-CoA synthetases (AMP-forming)/AMP-acid ligases II
MIIEMNSPKATRTEVRQPLLPRHWTSLAAVFVHQAKSQPHSLAVRDSFGNALTYRQLLIKSVALAHLLFKRLEDSECIGILLPPSAGAVIANIAVALLGKIPVNLNYTAGQKIFDSYLKKCELKHVISAEKLLKKTHLEPACDIIFLEDEEKDADLITKIKAWVESEFLPEELLGFVLSGLSSSKHAHLPIAPNAASEGNSGSSTNKLNDPATIIFTSGSTGNPKAVVLSNSNILSNIHAINLQGQIQKGEIVLGVIPFFHSFGLTMTLWAPLCLGETVIYHYDPLDARRIGELCERFQATCLICTPTMMSAYIRRCKPGQLASIKTCVLGGEKLKHQQSLSISDSLGIMPVEGYGLAETSPIVACNVPKQVTLADGREVNGTKPGTVGLPLPGTAVRIIDVFSKNEVPVGSQGLIQVKGPQVMLGYLNQPEETARVIQDGWFSTGDIGFLDADGFLTVTGRLSQFSKIAGEMVPHLAVEDELMRVTGLSGSELSVTSIPDEGRGERLIVVSTRLNREPLDVIDKLRKSTEMPRLWIPDHRDFIEVQSLPIMVNGKLDLQKIRQIAVERAATH